MFNHTGPVPCADIFAVAENRYPSGQTVHVLKTVGNKNDRNALVPQAFGYVIQILTFPVGKRGRRFIHNDNAGVS